MNDSQTDALVALVHGLRDSFSPEPLSDALLTKMYHDALTAIDSSKLVIMVLPIDHAPQADGSWLRLDELSRVNDTKRRVISDFSNAKTIEMAQFVRNNQDLLGGSWQHYTKEVNYKLFREIAATFEVWKSSLATTAMASRAERSDNRTRIARFVDVLYKLKRQATGGYSRGPRG